MTAFMYAKAIESITDFGFIDPITCTSDYTIIDGEHRWRAARDLGFTDVPVSVLDGLSEPEYRKLTIVLNELHGQSDPTKLSDLLADLLSLTSPEQLLRSMPFTEDILKGYLGFRDLDLPSSHAAPSATQGSPVPPAKEPWVERLFRVPNSMGILLDDAITKAKQDTFTETGEQIADWQALERIVADYMAG